MNLLKAMVSSIEPKEGVMKVVRPLIAALLVSVSPVAALAAADVQIRPADEKRAETGLQDQAQEAAKQILDSEHALADAEARAKACLDEAAGAVDKSQAGIRVIACRVTLEEAAADTYDKTAGRLSDLSAASAARARSIEHSAVTMNQAISALAAEKSKLTEQKRVIVARANALADAMSKNAKLSVEQRKAVADLRRENALADLRLASLDKRRDVANKALSVIGQAVGYYDEASVRLYTAAQRMRSNADRFKLAIDEAKFGAETEATSGKPFIEFGPVLTELGAFDPNRFNDLLVGGGSGETSETQLPNLPSAGTDDDVSWLKSFTGRNAASANAAGGS
jgi:hypothetical protein